MEENLQRNIWVDYLRSALTVLVVAHHASLAYTTFANFDSVAYIRSTHPIVDSRRWLGLDIFENFNDVFFMSLMFLIGGLFIARSINKKGISVFVKDRFYRLFLPFLLGGTILMLIAHFPAYIIARKNTNLTAYIIDFFTTEKWPVGPPWFIWVLFVFNGLFALIYPFIKKLSNKAVALTAAMKHKPMVFFIVLFMLTWLLYVPLAYAVGAGTWTGAGPFDFQLSRILLYAGYFMFGAFIGLTPFNQELFSTDSKLVNTWLVWVILALAIYVFLTVIEKQAILATMVAQKQLAPFAAWMIYFSIYVSSCVCSCIAFLTTFRKLIHKSYSWWNSLSANAYLIYLTHYVFVIWTQFWLLPYELPAFMKFLISFSVSLALSWGLSILLRKNRLIHKYL